MKASLYYLKFMTCTLLVLPVISMLNVQAQDSEYTDAPYFTGMPNYIIDYAEDIEFDNYHFFNGTNCPIVEGKKFLRQYVLKEGATKASKIQISRNYANAVRAMGGTVYIDGVYERDENGECADYYGTYLMVGKVVKDRNEVWIEVLPAEDNYRLTEVIKGVMKQYIPATDKGAMKQDIPATDKGAMKQDIPATDKGAMKQDITGTNKLETNIRDSLIAMPVGDVKSISPLEVKDFDGNVYKTVTIGTQVWMAENLRTTLTGTHTIHLVTDNHIWGNITFFPAYCWYNNDEAANKNTYGALYNYFAALEICPTGWHLPTNNDWLTLANYLGGTNVAGGKLKETGTNHWTSPNTGATNETGFTALPGGARGELGNFNGIGAQSIWWSYKYGNTSEISFAFKVDNDNSRLDWGQRNSNSGFFVRCIKSSQP